MIIIYSSISMIGSDALTIAIGYAQIERFRLNVG